MICLRCEDTGWTPVGTHTHCGAEYEEMGPCDCRSGTLIEFPAPDHRGKERVGPWGPNGYWQGRPKDLPAPQTRVFLSQAENAERMRDLVAQMSGVAKDIAA